MKSSKNATKNSFRFIAIGLSFLLLSSFVLASNWQSLRGFAEEIGAGIAAAPAKTFNNGTQTNQLTETKRKDYNLTIGVCDTAGPVEIESSGGTTTPTAYPTLKAAFDAVNGGTHSGTINIEVCGNTTETASAVLNASGSGSANYASVTITPVGARTVSGAIAAGSPLIDLNGADNVTINGLSTGGNSLTISNTTASAVASTSTIRFINDASGNTVTNSTVLGASNMTVATAGGTILFSTGTATGNDNNTISNNNIGPAGADLPTKAVSGLGTTTAPENFNSANSVTGNNIYDFFGAAVASAGVYIAGGNTDWTVNNNRLYQTAARTQTTATIHAGIRVDSANNNNVTVNGNTIGYAAANATGTYSFVGVAAGSKFYPIHFSTVGAATPSNVQGNTITNISVTGAGSGTSTSAAFAGILVSSGSGLVNIGNTTGNTVGSSTTAGAINVMLSGTAAADVYGIYFFPSDTAVISNNTVGGIVAGNSSTGAVDLYGIRAFTAAAVTNTFQNNQVGFAAAPLDVVSTATASQVIGLYSQSGIGNITGNTVRNLTTNAPNVGTTTTASVIGMWISGAAGTVVSQNTVHTLSNTSATGAVVVYGMLYSSATTGTNVVGRNFIHSLSLASSGAAVMRGILATAGATTFQNNMIRLGIDAAGVGVTGGYDIAGIAETGGTNNHYHNSVYIGGSAGTTAVNSFAFSSTVATGTRNVVNNIFANARTIAGGGGGNFAAQYGGTLPLPAGLNANGNIYHSADEAATIRNGTTAYTLAAWRSASGSQDSASIFASLAQINFVNPTGTSATVDLHVQGNTLAERNGIPVASVTDDFDGQTRADLTPVDIGADAGDFSFTDVAPPAISFTAFGNVGNFNNRVLTVTISDASGVASGANSPRIYFRKSTSGAYVSTQCVMTGGTPQNGTYDCTIDYSLIGGVVGGETIQYFVIAQDTLGNITSNAGGAVATDVNNVTTPPVNPYSYFVFPPFGATVDVGTGQTYTSLTNPNGLFDVLNQIGVPNSLTVNITSDLTAETGAIALNQLAEQGAGGYTLTIKPSGAARVISGTSAASNGLINLNGTDRVVFDGSLSGGTDRSLTITNNQTGTSTVFWIKSASASNGANNNTFKNLIINGAGTATAQTTAGILAGSGVTIGGPAEAPNNDNTVTNNHIYRVQNSLYNQGNTGFDQNWTVTNNEFGSTVEADKNRFRGMLMGNANNFVISGNTVLGVTNFTGTTGALSGIQLAFAVTNGSVIGNRISNINNASATGTGAFGMQLSASPTTNNLIANNFIWNIQAAGSATVANNGHGITINGGATAGGYKIYHNSVNLNTNQTTGTTAALNITSPTTPIAAGAIDLRNNILANTQTAGATRFAVFSAPGANVFSTIDYNDYFSTGSVGSLGGTVRATLADWQAATGQDANSKAVDPLFVSATDLHLQPISPMVAMGVSGTGVTTDIDGQTRDNPPDIGADELPAAGTPGVVQFSSATYTVSEAGGTVTLTVNRVGGSAGAISVNYSTANGSATGGASCAAGIDFVNAAGTLNWGGGDTAPKTFDVTVCNDAVFEAAETFTATLAGATGGAVIGTPNPATVTITNDDPEPLGSISINDVRVKEGNTGGANLVFTVTYTGINPASASVQYATANGTALANVDFLPVSGTISFASGATQTVAVPLIGKTLKEANETLYLNLSNPVNATIADNQGIGIIIDEDRAYLNDFDRDYYSDVSVFRPSEATWYIFNSASLSPTVVQFGLPTDQPVPGDYDGDGKADIALFRDGLWQYIASSTATVVYGYNGLPGDKPVQGDYDGDGKTDFAIFRPSNQQWWIVKSSDNTNYTVTFGLATDKIVQGDYDGDFKTDIALWRNGLWVIWRSSDNTVVYGYNGLPGDTPLSGDFDGDGKNDLAIYRPSNSQWWYISSLYGTSGTVTWGSPGDIPVPADYDRDGTTDITIWKPTTGEWYVLRSSDLSYFSVQWGVPGDIPLSSRVNPQ